MSWTNRVRNGEALHGVKEVRNILQTIKRMKAGCTHQILRRNCLMKHIIEEEIEGRT
jgi:hypothetical protein